MSAFGKALKGVQSILLLQNDVRRLEEEIDDTQDLMREFARDLSELDKRLVRLEGFIEGAAAAGGRQSPPQIEGN